MDSRGETIKQLTGTAAGPAAMEIARNPIGSQESRHLSVKAQSNGVMQFSAGAGPLR